MCSDINNVKQKEHAQYKGKCPAKILNSSFEQKSRIQITTHKKKDPLVSLTRKKMTEFGKGKGKETNSIKKKPKKGK